MYPVASHVAAFVGVASSATARTHHEVASRFIVPTVGPALATTLTSASSSLSVAAAPMIDYTSTAVAFFASVRVPSALIAGSSLSSLFSLTKWTSNKEEARRANKLERYLAIIFHGFCLASLVLSLNAIVTATAAGTTLLLGSHNGMATSAYVFMKREFHYEFVTTRWSFLVSLLSFIGGITTRALLEFDLLKKERRKWAIVLSASMIGLLSHLVSFINSTLNSWPNLVAMTVEVVKLIFIKAFIPPLKPLEMVSMVCFTCAIGTAISLVGSNSIFESGDEPYDEGEETQDGTDPEDADEELAAREAEEAVAEEDLI
uniref:Uncharacterized protein n=1 Tax=Grammatophora oceanica TaxID=210454 RepID=A0A7S1UYJ7_9STRA|mmetsp:Transcript_29573/g.43608  ORF Transcript_29573/g.43608 Transcript_29573/m.43608 type:complete len:317 (+) Transcript_29573:63-1013(+)|eukprot:CAMPEP_0194043332 /NCGR_PEP_ID=MMETSP0009_2-20130614/14995_1 /TAXON_ID=210454 /ORGANISM="Grammatophora oceanica, Strain CCMP 410" /LENGTH=316 /DNA_ID=CAMNT_0038687517 /DNA_START=56 /DNA_END=1006 /DNA_ORIENTATION=-